MSPRRSLAIGGFAGSAGLVFVWVAMSLVPFVCSWPATIASLVKANKPGNGLTSTRQHGSEANGAGRRLKSQRPALRQISQKGWLDGRWSKRTGIRERDGQGVHSREARRGLVLPGSLA